MLYDDDPITRQLKQSPFFDQTDSADVWDSFKEKFFSVAPPNWRLQSLKGMDEWLAQEDRPTRDHARLLNMRRELDDIHQAMRKAGR